ncbi:hypothetical protein CYMTET_24203, partial [Cymbomonas tetramitiformis]
MVLKFSSGRTLWAFAALSAIGRWVHANTSWGWGYSSTSTTSTLYDISLVDGAGWVVGANNTRLRSLDGGRSWSAEPYDVSLGDCKGCAWHGVSFLQGGYGWVVGTSARILHTSDGGGTWEAQASGVPDSATHNTATLLAVHAITASLAWAVGERGIVLRTEDGGSTWTPLQDLGQAAWETTHQVWFEGTRGVGWAVGGDGGILQTSDIGQSWVRLASCTEKALHDITVDFHSRFGFAVGSDGVICWSSDGGESFSSSLGSSDTSNGPSWYSVGVDNDGGS